jgi:neuron navigator 2
LGNSDPLVIEDASECEQIFIGSINISTRTNWEMLDVMIKQTFKDYLIRLDNNTKEVPSIGLSLNSISSYYVGEMFRCNTNLEKLPDLLPYGYLVGNRTNIVIRLNDALNCSNSVNDIDLLCYDTLIQKNRMQCYLSLLLEHKNLLFCGPNGTCKSYLARKLGEFLVKRHGNDLETSIAYFNVENKSSKDLKLFLRNISEQSSMNGEIPFVLVLDNLHFIGNNSDVFMEYFNGKNFSNNW